MAERAGGGGGGEGGGGCLTGDEGRVKWADIPLHGLLPSHKPSIPA